MKSSFISCVRKTAKKRIIFTEHALDRMNQEKEMTSTYVPALDKWKPDFKNRKD